GRLVRILSENEAPQDDASLVTSLVTGIPAGTREEVVVEVNSHAQAGIVDALAVQALLEGIDSALTLEQTGAILALASNRGATAQERLLERLSRLFLPGEHAALPTAAPAGLPGLLRFGAPEPFDARAALHERIIAVRAELPAPGSLRLTSLAGTSAATLAARAASSAAYRHALLGLDPFVVEGVAALEALPGLADTPAFGSLSAAYWLARADFLVAQIGMARDNSAFAPFSGHGAAVFRDEASGAALSTSPDAGPVSPETAYLFGAVAEDGGAASISGSALADHVFGGAGADALLGHAGRDVLSGEGGDDLLYGNDTANHDDAEPDVLRGGAGFDTYFVGDGDVVEDSDRSAHIVVGAGDRRRSLAGTYTRVADNVYRSEALDAALYLRGADATLVAFGQLAPARIRITAFREDVDGFVDGDFGISLVGDPGPDVPGLESVSGTVGDDRLTTTSELVGSAGNDLVRGLGGDDDLFGGAASGFGADRLEGGAGDDYLNSASPFDLGAIAETADDPGDVLDGGAGNDVATGNAGADRLLGRDGRDFLSGRGGPDELDGGPGNDLLAGGAGDDRLYGGAGDDILLGGFDVSGTPHRDWAATRVAGMEGAAVDIFFERVYLGQNPVAPDADTLHGGAGNDFLRGGPGDDFLSGDDGQDVLSGWTGADLLLGGAGDDVLYGGTRGTPVADTDDADELHGDAGDDMLYGEGGADRLHGGSGADMLDGGAGGDLLRGGAGADRLLGGSGADVLDGGAGADVLYGGSGADRLRGGPGGDALDGGRGDDTYQYALGDGHDVIEDAGGFDRLVIEGVADLPRVPITQLGGTLRFEFDEDNSLTVVDWAGGAVDQLVSEAHALAGGGAVDENDFGRVMSANAGARGSDGDDIILVDQPVAAIDGGAGDDYYVLAAGVGPVRFDDAAGTNVLALPDGIALTDLEAVESLGIVTLAAPGVAASFAEGAIGRLRFGDGSDLAGAALADFIRHSPRVNAALGDVTARVGGAFELVLPGDTFVDADAGEALTLSVTGPGGTALPAWLDFDAVAGRFAGTPAAADLGASLRITVTASDPDGLAVSDGFFIDLVPAASSGPGLAFVGIDDVGAGAGFVTRALRDYGRAPGRAEPVADLLAGAGDLNADGIDDLIRFRGARPHAPGDELSVIFGRPQGFGATLDAYAVDGDNGFRVTGAGSYTADYLFGTREIVAAGVVHGDVNGDGIDDLLLPGGSGRDTRRVVLGAASPFAAELAFTTLPDAAVFGAELPNDGLDVGRLPDFGRPGARPYVPAGDVNGDGLRDGLVVGAGGAAAAVVFATETPASGFVTAADLSGSNGFRIVGDGLAAAAFGSNAFALGDVNGDGLDDIGLSGELVSFDLIESAGAVVYGAAGGHGGEVRLRELGPAAGYLAGHFVDLGTDYYTHVHPAGDVNGDSLDDVIVSSSWTNSSYVVYGAGAGAAPVTLGTPGRDVLTLSQPADVYAGGGDDDVTALASGAYTVYGGSGRDNLRFGAATVSPGGQAGEFARGTRLTFKGGAGGDNYFVFGAGGDVRLVINDPVLPSPGPGPGDEPNRVVFGSGYDLTLLRNRIGSLHLDFGPGQPGIVLASFDAADVLGGPRDVDEFLFADGTRLSFEDVVALGFDIDGTPQDDHLTGTSVVDRIIGHAGDDALDGGPGNDVLDGGPGNDRYLVRRGDGHDRVRDGGGQDTIELGTGIKAADLELSRRRDDVLLELGAADSVLIEGGATLDGAVEFLAFADDTRVAVATLLNTAPVAAPPPPMAIAEDVPWTLAAGARWFHDPDPGELLSFTLRRVGGGDVPGWLNFDPASGTLGGTPGNENTGPLVLALVATDRAGAAAVATLELTVINVNDAPVMAMALPDRAVTAGGRADFALPAGTFVDADPGDLLRFTAAGAHGGPLPAWLAFDPATTGFSGLPGNADVGRYEIRVTATDRQDAAASATFFLDVLPAVNHIRGSAGADRLVGAAGRDVVYAGDGDDVVVTFGGDDSIQAGNGRDLVDAGAGHNRVFGGAGADAIVAAAGDDYLAGGAGDDTIEAGDGANRILGQGGHDRITSGRGDDRIDGGDGRDLVTAGAGNDIIRGGNGHDYIDAGVGHNTVFAGHGDDVITAGDGDDVLEGGAGADLIDARGGHNTVRGGGGEDRIRAGGGDDDIDGGDHADDIESGAGDDRVHGRNHDDVIDAGPGDDRVFGGHGRDRLIAGAGDDLVDGGAGDDLLDAGDGNNVVRGGGGDDRIVTGAGNDEVDAGDGADRVVSGAGDDIVRGRNHDDVIDAGPGDDRVFGGHGRDRVTAGAGDDLVDGGAGDDFLDAGDGNNLVRGGGGDDRIVTGAGNDEVDAGDGADRVLSGAGDDIVRGRNHDDVIDAGPGDNVVYGDHGDDVLISGAGNDFVSGGSGDDVIDAGDGSNEVNAGSGADVVTTGAGSDRIDGREGDDYIDAGGGDDQVMGHHDDDRIVGGDGSDQLDGGWGNDSFLYAGTTTGFDRVIGSHGFDGIVGGRGDDLVPLAGFEPADGVEWIDGGAGVDLIVGAPAGVVFDFSRTALRGIERIAGGAGDDAITGSAGNDVIAGGGGTDRLAGGPGSDRYELARAGVATHITDAAGEADEVRFIDPETGAADLWFARVADDLRIVMADSEHEITIADWFDPDAGRAIERFRLADGRTATAAAIGGLVQAMAGYAAPAAGDAGCATGAVDALESALALAWQPAAA
ncbi:MAG: putative Ig domain-containing protein, partial [Gammaproteobacteria bacterium]